MSKALEISKLHAWYGESHILHGIDFEVREGELVTLLGRNGAGRTTTLKAILGLTGKRTGTIEVAGVETSHMQTNEIARLGLGYCPEERGTGRDGRLSVIGITRGSQAGPPFSDSSHFVDVFIVPASIVVEQARYCDGAHLTRRHTQKRRRLFSSDGAASGRV